MFATVKQSTRSLQVMKRQMRFSSSMAPSMPFVSTNPTTGQILKSFEFVPRRDVDTVIDKSWKCFQSFKQTSFAERASVCNKIAENLLTNKQRYAEMLTLEVGKTLQSAVAEVEKSAQALHYFAKEAERMLSDEVVPSDGSDSRIIYQPLGPILQAAPFNYPFWQVVRFAAPALMAGNVIIVRHSHSVPQSAELLAEAFTSNTGLPEHGYKNVFLDNPSVSKLVQDTRLRGVTFTGSTQTGRVFAELAGRNLKKHVLELGGSDPLIVLSDADLDLAVQIAVSGRCVNNGQSCVASKRFLVEKPVVKEFTERLVSAFKGLKMGDPMDPNVQIGPLARRDLRDKLAVQVNMTVSQGAQLLTGGTIPKSPGFFYTPTVLGSVMPGMVSEEEEVFGPVASIIEVKDQDEALAIANHSEYGLGASVFTTNDERAKFFERELDSGMVFVNGMTKSMVNMPFGGVKHSGYGRELSRHGLLEFVNIKTVWKK